MYKGSDHLGAFAILTLLVMVAALLMSTNTAAQSWQDLPDGDGKSRAVEACSSCHGVDRIPKAAGRSEAEWRATVHDMIGRGAMVYPEDIDPITDYLVRYFGPAGSGAGEGDARERR